MSSYRGNMGSSGQTGVATTNFPGCRRMQVQRNGRGIMVEFLLRARSNLIEWNERDDVKVGIENGERERGEGVDSREEEEKWVKSPRLTRPGRLILQMHGHS